MDSLSALLWAQAYVWEQQDGVSRLCILCIEYSLYCKVADYACKVTSDPYLLCELPGACECWRDSQNLINYLKF